MKRPTKEPPSRESHLARLLGKTFTAGATFAVHFLVTMLVIVFLGSVVPRFIQVFESHNTALPQMTLLLVAMSIWNTKFWYLFVPAFLVVDAPIAFGLQFLPERMRWIRVCWFDSYLLLAVLFLFLASVALSVPIEGLIVQASPT